MTGEPLQRLRGEKSHSRPAEPEPDNTGGGSDNKN